jgi:hypothetical protein
MFAIQSLIHRSNVMITRVEAADLSLDVLAALLLDPSYKFLILSREAAAGNRRDWPLQVYRSAAPVLPFTSSFPVNYGEIGEAEASVARVASTDKCADILLSSERRAVHMSREVALRPGVGMGRDGKFVDDEFGV